MTSPQPVASHASSPLWTGFKVLVLVVGGTIAFMPDEMRPIAWRLTLAFVESDSGRGLLAGVGAVAVCFVALWLVGHWLMPDEPDPR